MAVAQPPGSRPSAPSFWCASAALAVMNRDELTSIREYTKNLMPFLPRLYLGRVAPKRIVAYKTKRYAAGMVLATINRELACTKKAFNLRELGVVSGESCRAYLHGTERNRRNRWLSRGEEEPLLRLQTRLFTDNIEEKRPRTAGKPKGEGHGVPAETHTTGMK